MHGQCFLYRRCSEMRWRIQESLPQRFKRSKRSRNLISKLKLFKSYLHVCTRTLTVYSHRRYYYRAPNYMSNKQNRLLLLLNAVRHNWINPKRIRISINSNAHFRLHDKKLGEKEIREKRERNRKLSRVYCSASSDTAMVLLMRLCQLWFNWIRRMRFENQIVLRCWRSVNCVLAFSSESVNVQHKFCYDTETSQSPLYGFVLELKCISLSINLLE